MIKQQLYKTSASGLRIKKVALLEFCVNCITVNAGIALTEKVVHKSRSASWASFILYPKYHRIKKERYKRLKVILDSPKQKGNGCCEKEKFSLQIQFNEGLILDPNANALHTAVKYTL